MAVMSLSLIEDDLTGQRLALTFPELWELKTFVSGPHATGQMSNGYRMAQIPGRVMVANDSGHVIYLSQTDIDTLLTI